MPEEFKIIAIDGGAASGKSSTARLIAERFKLLYVDTGSHYRAVTYFCLNRGLSSENSGKLGSDLNKIQIDTVVRSRSARIRLSGFSPTSQELRSPQVNREVSQFSAVPQVRQFLLDYQRSLASFARNHEFHGIVMEGRDIGSVVFPDADFKFYLEADQETRARRRSKEGLRDPIEERDKTDSTRNLAPLHCPQGAIRINNSKIPLVEVVEQISQIIEGNQGRQPPPSA